jgi:hypothetical protein
VLFTAANALAEDPWTNSANNLKTGWPNVAALIAVAIVITGTTFAFSQGRGDGS